MVLFGSTFSCVRQTTCLFLSFVFFTDRFLFFFTKVFPASSFLLLFLIFAFSFTLCITYLSSSFFLIFPFNFHRRVFPLLRPCVVSPLLLRLTEVSFPRIRSLGHVWPNMLRPTCTRFCYMSMSATRRTCGSDNKPPCWSFTTL